MKYFRGLDFIHQQSLFPETKKMFHIETLPATFNNHDRRQLMTAFSLNHEPHVFFENLPPLLIGYPDSGQGKRVFMRGKSVLSPDQDIIPCIHNNREFPAFFVINSV